MSTNSWLLCTSSSKPVQSRLFCLPYTGGDASAYRSWTGELPRGVDVCAAQLPGRGKRIREPRITRMDALIPLLVEAMRESLGQPFAIFGHDLGALIAFELARSLRRMSLPQPARLFLFCHRAPNLPSRVADIHRLEESESRKELRLRADVPEEVLEHEELMALVSPILRADFEIEETYSFVAEDPLDVPFTIVGGLADDRVDASELEAWRQQTRAEARVEMLPGDHSYLHSQHKRLLEVITRELQRHP